MDAAVFQAAAGPGNYSGFRDCRRAGKHIVFQAAAEPGNYSGILGCPRTGKIGEYHVWKKEKAAFGNTAL